MGRKSSSLWRTRLLGVLLLALAGGAIYLWWMAQHWTPSREEYPSQGVLVGADDGPLDFRALAAVGANFAYVEASLGGEGRDAMLDEHMRELAGSGLPFGAIHEYDPCVPAEEQAANFVTIVPRDAAQLPPVVSLDKLATDCANPLAEASVEAELITFLNQLEGHTGQAAILRLSPAFEEHYGIARRIERNLWLTRPYVEPDYAGRPWTLWTANPRLWTEGADQPLRWVVVQQ